MSELIPEIKSSHVGSFPLSHKDELIGKILNDLTRIGLDVPPYPQMRSFINMFLDPLAELGLLDKREDFFFSTPEKLLSNSVPEIRIPEAVKALDYIKRSKLNFKGLRGPVTGAFTLASRVYFTKDISKGLSATALANKRVLKDFFIPYVRSCIKFLSKLGYTHLFVDEPILGVITGRKNILFGYDKEDVEEALNFVFSDASGKIRGIHVCGVVSRNLFQILASIASLNIINFEFYDSRRNLKIIDAETLESGSKLLAPGVASSKKPIVEPVKEIKSLLNELMNATGGRIDLVSADCGFGGLGTGSGMEMYRIGLMKLRNIVKAIEELNT